MRFSWKRWGLGIAGDKAESCPMTTLPISLWDAAKDKMVQPVAADAPAAGYIHPRLTQTSTRI
jgi:hypothetical protein